MFSISQLRKNLFPLFKLMRDTGMVVEVVYNNTVYDLTIAKTKKKPIRHRAKVKRTSSATVQDLPATICEECGSLRFSGICMNKQCPSNP